MKTISTEKRNNIVALLDSGLSERAIALQLSVSRITVARVRSQVRPDAKRSQGGRTAKLTTATTRRLVRMITSGKADTATQLTRELNSTTRLNVSADTVRRALKKAGMKSAGKVKKPRLLPHHIRARLDFAVGHKDWTVEDWKRIIWSDETKINRLGSDGRSWVWRKRGTALTSQHVKGTVNFGGGSMMIWGCMTAQGIGFACRIDGRMDAELYTTILRDEFMDSLEYYHLNRDEVIFQQDNDPKHTSRLARQWFSDNKIEVMEWPSQSPDLNPIEHLWQHLKRRLATYETEPDSMGVLWQRVVAEWNAIPVDICTNLIDSMPRRVAAVIKAKGGYTKY